MSEFERLLKENLSPLQRFVKFKINNRQDAEDIIQEVCYTATVKFDTLENPTAFKAWLIAIASNKCNDYYRRKAREMNISLESLSESELSSGKFDIIEQSVVHDTLKALGNKERQILYLYYLNDLSHEDISRKLAIPIGTVKSRLHYAKEKFKKHYPSKEISKGETIMKKLPEYLSEYKIERSDLAPFSVIHEELPGMFIIPRMGNSVSFGMYDMPSRKQSGVYELSVNGKVAFHGVEGVSVQKNYSEKDIFEESTIFAQLTDTNCRYLGGMYTDENGVQRVTTFLDSEFDENYGIGVDNCGFSTHRKEEGLIKQTDDGLVMPVEHDISDIVGRFRITLNGQVYDTVRLIDYQIYADKGGMLCEHYLDKNGRSVLWRRFNNNNWAQKRYGKLWTEMLPENERLIVNGKIYVHWFDCVTDYIF